MVELLPCMVVGPQVTPLLAGVEKPRFSSPLMRFRCGGEAGRLKGRDQTDAAKELAALVGSNLCSGEVDILCTALDR